MDTKNATVRLPKNIADYLSQNYSSINQGIIETINAFLQIRSTSMNELKGVFAKDEWKFFADSLNGTLVDGVFRTNVGALVAQCEDSARYDGLDQKWNLNLEALIKKVKSLKGANIEALYTRVEAFWNHPEDLEGWSEF